MENTNININEQFIRDYMKQNNISSLNKLAEKIGISPATLSRILNGERNPGQMVIGRMLTYFGVKFETLFSYDLPSPKVNKSDVEVKS